MAKVETSRRYDFNKDTDTIALVIDYVDGEVSGFKKVLYLPGQVLVGDDTKNLTQWFNSIWNKVNIKQVSVENIVYTSNTYSRSIVFTDGTKVTLVVPSDVAMTLAELRDAFLPSNW